MRNRTAIPAAVALLSFLAACGLVRTRETETYAMTWRVQSVRAGDCQLTEVVLTYRDFPDYEVGVFSEELARHLQGLGKEVVTAELEVTYDLWWMRSYRLVHVEGMAATGSRGGYHDNGRDDGLREGRSPWD